MKNIRLFALILFCNTGEISTAQTPADTLEKQDFNRSAYTFLDVNTRSGESDYQSQFMPYTMTTPDMNLMIRSINSSADKYTGVANTQIPIYNMELNSSTLPITLCYAATGIRLGDVASTVGLGWRLAVGGKITRVVRGRPDVYNKTNQKLGTSYIDLWTYDKFQLYYDNYWLDSQPDLYYYELPGMSGSFVVDGQEKAHTIPYKNIEIVLSGDGFKIYDEAGNCYFFNTVEYSWNDPTSGHFFGCNSSWYLDKIEYLNGDSVNFKYKRGENYSYDNFNQINRLVFVQTESSQNYHFDENIDSADMSAKIKIDKPVYLDEISYREQLIRFAYDSNRSDNSKMQKLNKITVSKIRLRDTLAVRTFAFQYDTFKNSKRLKLAGIEERPSDNLARPICNFEYYEDVTTAENDSSFEVDHWGFCNTNTHRYTYPSVLLHSDIDKSIKVPSYVGASREPVLEFTRVRSLKKITFATGGTREFEYELHNGLLLSINANRNAGGLRIKRIIEKENPTATPSIYSYEYRGGIIYDDAKNYLADHWVSDIYYGGKYKTTYFIYMIASKNLNQSVDFYGSSVIYSTVIEHLPNKSSVRYDYTPLNMYHDLPPTIYNSYTNTVTRDENPNDSNGRIPMTNRSWGRYMLKSKTSYDADKNMLDSITYEYKIDSAQMVQIPGYIIYIRHRDHEETGSIPSTKSANTYCVGEYFSVSCPVFLQRQITHKGKNNLPSETLYIYNSYNQVSIIDVKQSDGTWVNTKFRYPQDIESNDLQSVSNRMRYRNARIPLEEVFYKNGEVYAAIGRSYRLNEMNSNAIVLESEKTLAEQTPIFAGNFAPVTTTTTGMAFNNYYKNVKTYLDYNATGQLLCYEDENGIRHSYVYRNTTQPIATVTNARHSLNPNLNQVYFDNFEETTSPPDFSDAKSGVKYKMSGTYTIDTKLTPDTYKVIFWEKLYPWWKKRTSQLEVTSSSTFPLLSLGLTVIVDDVCIIPQNAVISSCFSVPGWGNLSETDGRGRTTYTEYNGLGLPTTIKDDNRTIVKKFAYQ